MDLHQLLHELLKTWFHWVEAWGYWGVGILMAMESSILPVPSEIVIPPAAFWAAQGRMSFIGVVLAGTVGSYIGSVLNYFFALYLGKPLLHRYGKYFFFPPDKLRLAEKWVDQFGTFGVFIARLLPVVRHLISIPAGLLKMEFLPFSLATIVGAAIWCTILAWFGQEIIGAHPELLESPESMIHVMKAKLMGFILAVLGMGLLYLLVLIFKKKMK